MTSSPKAQRWALVYVLTAFVALGAALHAALGVSPRFSSGAAAYVNGAPISQSEYARAIKAMQAGLERPLTEADQARALDRLIDEELIVQEAIQLGLPSSDRLVRRNLVQGMMRSVTSLETGKITDGELRTFFEENRNLFKTPRLVSIVITRSDDPAVSTEFVKNLQSGKSFTEAAKELDLEQEFLPENLPTGKVGSLIGGAAVDMITRMKAGDIAGPARAGDQDVFIWMTGDKGGEASFETLRETVKAELERRRDEAALDEYLEGLRKRARIKKAATDL